MRTLTALERTAVLALAAEIASDDERNQLVEDLAHCKVDVLSHGARLMFHIEGYERPRYRGQDAFRGRDGFPVEGTVLDQDGTVIDVALYSDQNNRVLELELVKHSAVAIPIADWTTFRLK